MASGDHQQKTHRLDAAPLTAEAFAPFGRVIAPRPGGSPANAAELSLDLSNGHPRFYAMTLADKPARFTAITRHRRVGQALAAAGGGEWMLVVAPADPADGDAAVPALEALCAFVIPGDTAVVLDRGTWHAGPFFTDAQKSFFNLELADTNDTDHHSVSLSDLYGVEVEVVGHASNRSMPETSQKSAAGSVVNQVVHRPVFRLRPPRLRPPAPPRRSTMADLVPFDANTTSLRETFSLFPSGVAAISAVVDGERKVLVASSFQVGISADPPLVLFAVQRSSTTWPVLRGADRLGVSVLGEAHDAACRQLASKVGDRFAGVETTTTESGAVFVEASPIWLECSIESELPAGDHEVVLLRVHAMRSDPATRPLVFHASGFRTLSA